MEILFQNSLLSVLLIWGNYSHVHLGRHMGENASTIRNARERCWGGCTQKTMWAPPQMIHFWLDLGHQNDQRSTLHYLNGPMPTEFFGSHVIFDNPSCASWGFLIASIAGGKVERKWPVLSRHDKSTGKSTNDIPYHHTTMFRFCSLGCGLWFRHKQILRNPPFRLQHTTKTRFCNKFTV